MSAAGRKIDPPRFSFGRRARTFALDPIEKGWPRKKRWRPRSCWRLPLRP